MQILQKDYTFFIIITAISFLVLIMVQPFTLIGGDEGRFIQDALRMGRGEIPIADYTTRAPILSWFLFQSTELFGRSILAFRLPGLLFSALTAGFLYLLGRELTGMRNVGILAAIFFALAPYTLWYNSLIKTEALVILLVIAGAFLLVKGLGQKKLLYIFFAGVFIGAAYIDRQSVLAVALAFPLFMIWQITQSQEYKWHGDSLRYIMLYNSMFIIGGIIGFLPVFFIIALHDINAALGEWLFLNSVQSAVFAKAETANAATSSLFGFLRTWTLAFVEILAIQAWVLFAGFTLFIAACFSALLRQRRRSLEKTTFIITLVLLVGTFFIHVWNIAEQWSFRPLVFILSFLFTFISILLSIFLGGIENLTSSIVGEKRAVVFIVLVCSVYIFAYSVFLPGYTRELIPWLALATAIIVCAFSWHNTARVHVLLISISIIGLWFSGISWFLNPPTGGWWWEQESINTISSFLEMNTQTDDTVFAANPLPVMLANLRIPADMTSYHIKFAEHADHQLSTFPTPNEYIALLYSDPPRYALIDGRMENHFFASYPMFKEFVKENYRLVMRVEGSYKRDWTEIWEYQGIRDDN